MKGAAPMSAKIIRFPCIVIRGPIGPGASAKPPERKPEPIKPEK
jgi:hypothetical protein